MRLSLHNDILDSPSRFLIFSHNICVEGLLFSRPWLCRRWLLEPLFLDPHAAPGTPLLLFFVVVVFSSFLFVAFTLVLASFLGGDYHYTTIIFHTTKVNIDIGTKILKAKFAGRFRHFFDTSQKFKPICAVAFFILRWSSTTPAL